MNNSNYIHWFIAGLFVAASISQSTVLALVFAAMLILFWSNIALPLLLAFFLDTVFVHERAFSNAYGFIFVIIVLLLGLVLFPSQRFLKMS